MDGRETWPGAPKQTVSYRPDSAVHLRARLGQSRCVEPLAFKGSQAVSITRLGLFESNLMIAKVAVSAQWRVGLPTHRDSTLEKPGAPRASIPQLAFHVVGQLSRRIVRYLPSSLVAL